MGDANSEIDAWLQSGGVVVTASDRAARAIASAFHCARREEGATAWPAPNILDWKSFVRTAWEERAQNGATSGRLVLNSTQERSLWAEIAGSHNHVATLLEGPRHRLAGLAMEAHELLCSYAPQLLRPQARAGWQRDAAAFSDWLTAFDQACRAANVVSPARLQLELKLLLENSPSAGDQAARPPLLLAGFDRILPTQRSVFDGWGAWRQAALSQPAAKVHFHQAADAQSELGACALWCADRLAADPQARLLVVTQNAADRTARGQLERAFLRQTGSSFEFSLGIPLSQVALAKAAHLLLRWLSGPLAEHELDWLLSTGYHAASTEVSAELQKHMLEIRRRHKQQPGWTLQAFQSALPANTPPALWGTRMNEARRQWANLAARPQAPLVWAELVPRLLQTAGFPGYRPLSSGEFQAADRWRHALESCGSLGFDGRRIAGKDFLSDLARSLDETLYAPESRDAPIQIAGPAESAGLKANGIWFLGANEDAWPAGGAMHPLLPPEVQRQAGMPHAAPQLDWDLAQAITNRLTASAAEIHFSCAIQTEKAETRPSRLISTLAGLPQPLPAELTLQPHPPPQTVVFEDFSRIPFPPGRVPGGAAVLTAQSQCPFKAFATARLAAQGWEPASAGLTAAQRGSLLHAVLHSVWAGPPQGIDSHRHLHDGRDLSTFVRAHVRQAIADEIGPDLRNRLPHRYLELEEQRLTKLVSEWLAYEATRIEFEVAGTEVARSVTLAGLNFDLRLDRVDRLQDGSLLVVDYKSGDVTTKSWNLPRPDDVQLPLYAGFALREDESLGGLVFAKVRAGGHEFIGRVGNAKDTLLGDLSGNNSLVRHSLSVEELMDWRTCIEQLAVDFLAGRADVAPREYPKTCVRCGLQPLCRIEEDNHAFRDGEEEEGEGDE